MKRQAWLRVVVVLALLAAAGLLMGIIFTAVGRWPRRTLVFPDGSRVALLGAAVGGQQINSEEPWHKLARRWLPPSCQGWLPEPFSIDAMGSSNNLTICLKVVDAKTNRVGLAPWIIYAAMADDGSPFEPLLGGAAFFDKRSIQLTAFPRRQRRFDLQFLGQDGRPFGSISVPNPVRGPFPEWTPERLPIRRTNGPLTVTLESVTDYTASPPKWSQIQPKWKFESTDPLWRNAKQEKSDCWSDATGNRGRRLGYDERAWKLSLEFRRDPTNHTDSDRFVLPWLTVPEPGASLALTNEFERMGLKIKFRSLNGLDRYTAQNGVEDPACFVVDVSPLAPLQNLYFLTTSFGKGIPLFVTYDAFPDGGGGCFHVYMEAPSGTIFRLQGYVDQTRLLEFIIDPAEIRRVRIPAG